MALKVLVTDYKWPDLEIEKEVLSGVDAELAVAPDGEEETLVDLAQGCVGIMTCWAQTTRRVIEAALPDLKVIARYGVGLDNIDVDFATRAGIPVTYVPTYCVVDVAEHALAYILALSRKLSLFNRKTREGVWDIQVGMPLRRLQGKCLGIVGFGHIGREVARRARAFDLEICVCDPVLSEEEALQAEVQLLSFEELLEKADFITLHVPLIPATESLIGRAELERMKPTAFLINTARGGLIDEDALYQALIQGEIGGAGLDVRRQEPPEAGDRLLGLDQVLHSPHAAFYSTESLEELERQTAWEVRRVLEGQEPNNLVNPDYRSS